MVENTSKRDPILHVLGVMSEGASGYIEGMERDGQRQLVHSDVLPTKGPWADLEQMGFVKGEQKDDLFTSATLPDGWKRDGSAHAMWSYILDQHGIRRVAVFYKAAFYDRGAHFHISRPGFDAANDAIYGDGKVKLPAHWQHLTAEERRDAINDANGYLEQAAEYPDIYADRKPRAERFLELATASSDGEV